MHKKLIYKQNDIGTIDEVINLSIDTFRPKTIQEEEKYHSRKDWIEKISEGGLLISAFDGKKCIGFSFTYEREPESKHIWIVAVDKDYRKKGVWKHMYQKTLDWSKKLGTKKITINTYKDKFPNMYKFLLNNDFNIYREKAITSTNKELTKSYFEKEL